MADGSKTTPEPEMKGWLYKWTNYLKGYQKRWFVLYNGLLSYYRSPGEVSHTCRGTINLVSAVIHTVDSSNFVISNGGTQTFHLKAANEVERQRWVTALELAKARAIRMTESDEEEELGDKCGGSSGEGGSGGLQGVLRALQAKLDDLGTCHQLILRHGNALQRSLSELEGLDDNRAKQLNERATLFRITANAMINACTEYVALAEAQGRKWQRLVQHEHEQRLRLEEMVEQLAKQHSILERAAKEHNNPSTAGLSHSDDEEFYDADEDAGNDYVITIPGKMHRRTGSGFSLQSESEVQDGSSDTDPEPPGANNGLTEDVIARAKKRNKMLGDQTASSPFEGKEQAQLPSPSQTQPAMRKPNNRKRRTTIPEKPNYSLNLWSIMKNCIGKELTKIPMPVNFNEPLSTLQRLTEEYEYSDLLDTAAGCEDSCEQLAYVAAYTVSAYATTSNRTGKPFNPLLGETYECDRTDDLGWRCLSEQVSHHPPMLAQHCEGRGWVCWQEFSMSSKFRGKYLQIVPLGIAHLLFPSSGHHYTWRKVTTSVHNIIVGKLWVDHHGEMDIANHTTGDKAHIRFLPYSYFSREMPRKVTGVVTDQEGIARFVLQGTWDSKMEAARVLNSRGSKANQPLTLETSEPKTIWTRVLPGPESEKLYNFTELACQLNEPEEDVAPTDSRLRPDQRLMEAGQWDEANRLKLRLEEKQRTVRRKKEQDAEIAAQEGRPYEGYEPVWFQKETDPITGNPVHKYTGEYWECKDKQDWERCPNIFL